MNNFRVKEGKTGQKYNKNTMDFDESTFYYSSEEKERLFVNAQFKTEEQKKTYKFFYTKI